MRFTCILLALACAACGGRRLMLARDTVVEHPGVISVSADRISSKRGRFSLRLSIRNLSGETLVLKRKDLHCTRDGKKGRLRSGRRASYKIKAQGTVKLRITCDARNRSGSYAVRIDQVFRSGDDAPLVQDFVWAVTDLGALDAQASSGRAGGAPAVGEKTVSTGWLKLSKAPLSLPPIATAGPGPAPKSIPAKTAPIGNSGLEQGASPMSQQRYGIGRELYMQGNVAGAAAEFESAFDIFPRSAKLAFNIARCHERLGNNRKAVRFYQKYLELAPADASDRGDIERLVKAMKRKR